MMQLSSLDAEFLDGMIAAHQTLREASEKYISASDASSNPMVVDMARGTLEQINYADQMFREARGHADGDSLRQQENEAAVEVTAAY